MKLENKTYVVFVKTFIYVYCIKWWFQNRKDWNDAYSNLTNNNINDNISENNNNFIHIKTRSKLHTKTIHLKLTCLFNNETLFNLIT